MALGMSTIKTRCNKCTCCWAWALKKTAMKVAIFIWILSSCVVGTINAYGGVAAPLHSYSTPISVVFNPPDAAEHVTYRPPSPSYDHHHVPVSKDYVSKDHSTQFQAQDMMGQYVYGYSTSNGIFKNEARNADGNVVGSYSYISPEGKQVSVTYTAGEDGFRASSDAIPKQVEPTSEVVQATKQHLTAIKAADQKSEYHYASPSGLSWVYSPSTVPVTYHHPVKYSTVYRNPVEYPTGYKLPVEYPFHTGYKLDYPTRYKYPVPGEYSAVYRHPEHNSHAYTYVKTPMYSYGYSY